METGDLFDACPRCGAAIPVNRDFVSWCDQCNWNVNPREPREKPGRLQAIYRSLGARRSDNLLAGLQNAGQLRPRFTVSKVLAIMIAFLVHAATLLLVCLGVLIIVTFGLNLFSAIIVLGCFAAAWLGRPRFNPYPVGIVSLSAYPNLYGLVDELASILGLSGEVSIVLAEDFNASMMLAGWRRERVLKIGLPLWEILNDHERVALIGHELAHSVNGDISRSLLVGSALRTLAEWYAIFQAREYQTVRYNMLQSIALLPGRLLQAISARLVQGVYLALMHLMWQDSQRAEYLADYLGATVSGTAAQLAVLGKLHFAATFDLVATQVRLHGVPPKDLFKTLREQIERVPEREIERIKRLEALLGSRLDTTHPPTINRIRVLDAFPVATPAFEISPAQMARIEGELAPERDRIQRRIVSQYRASPYR
jgi:Zn-dependent protease with chaperone function